MITVSAATTAGRLGAADTGNYHWKPVAEAQLKIDGKPPLAWNVYQPEKKKGSSVVLLLLGRRYIAIDFKAKLAYQVLPASIQKRGDDIESGDLRISSQLIPSTAWSERDVGPAELIEFTLKDYGAHVIEVSLPHPPDLRSFY
jgi:hypothetical protein